MARITTHRGSAKDTHNYYLADYYDAGPAFAGRWLGQGANLLGLEGEVDSKQFMRLLENRHPKTGEKLSQRDRANRRNGWDVTFSSPKSVSIAFGLGNDLEIVDAIREATNETLLEMEQDVMRRVNLAGRKQRHVKTGNFVSAVWVHPDARAVNGHVPDVQLHTHGFISNHTFDFESDRWLAADISNLFRDAQGYYESAFQSRLATRLQSLGYEIERSQNDFEIVGISRELIAKFSKRSGEINRLINDEKFAEKIAAKRGISLDDAKGMVGALSRNHKNKKYSFEELQPLWQLQLADDEQKQLDLVKKNKGIPKERKPTLVTAKEAVDFALNHGFEREAVLRERNVLRDAIKYGIEANTVDEIKAELAGRDLIRQGQDEAAILTTKALQEEEKQIIDFARFGRGSVTPLAARHKIELGTLSKEQAKAVSGLLKSSDRLQIVRGVAGVGKSYMLGHLVPAIDKPIAIMAPTNKATDNLRDDGFDASTIQSFLLDEKAQQQVKNGVIIVDEAGLLGSPTFRSLVGVADRQNARIIAIGDDRQHLPIERGHPLKLLEKQAGIKPKLVSEIRRQKGRYKDAVAALSRGDIAEGFERLQKLGFVHEIEGDDRDAALATAFADARQKNKNQKLLVIAPTHAERRKITDSIREELKLRGLISTKEKETRNFTTLVSKSLTQAQQEDPLNYQKGDVVVFHRKATGGIQSGDQLTITDVQHDKVVADGKQIPLDASGSFSVFRPETSEYAIGDVIRLTRGRRQDAERKKLANGSLHKIKSFHKGVVILDNGQRLESNWRFFDQGIAVTSHVSQGTTVDRAFLSASSLSFPGSSPEQMYVSASRPKKRVDIYTDSADGLMDAISRFRPKQLASDVTPDDQAKQSKRPFGKKLNRIKDIAQKFATKQLKRFGDWLPSNQLQPQLER